MTCKDTSGRKNYLLVYTFDKKFRVALFMNKNNARRVIGNVTPSETACTQETPARLARRVVLHMLLQTTRTGKSVQYVEKA